MQGKRISEADIDRRLSKMATIVEALNKSKLHGSEAARRLGVSAQQVSHCVSGRVKDLGESKLDNMIANLPRLFEDPKRSELADQICKNVAASGMTMGRICAVTGLGAPLAQVIARHSLEGITTAWLESAVKSTAALLGESEPEPEAPTQEPRPAPQPDPAPVIPELVRAALVAIAAGVLDTATSAALARAALDEVKA